MSKMPLFVHTYGRGAKQTTLDDWLRGAVKPDRVFVVVQDRERDKYSWVVRRGHHLLILPPPIQMLSPTRQWIMDYAHRQGMKSICLMDDDLRFFARKAPTVNTKATHSLLNATKAEVADMFDLLEEWLLSGIAHCGLSAREGNNRVEEKYTDIGRMMRCLAYRTDIVKKVGARFDRIDTKQDFDMTLQLLRSGYPNRISWFYAQGQATGSGAKGGCATYRTEAMMDRCANELAALHQGFVKVVKKETKTSFGGGERTDVTVYWQKAFENFRGEKKALETIGTTASEKNQRRTRS